MKAEGLNWQLVIEKDEYGFLFDLTGTLRSIGAGDRIKIAGILAPYLGLSELDTQLLIWGQTWAS